MGIYFACVFGGLLGITYSLIFLARTKQWKPKPIKLVWGILVICLADFAAGLVCSLFAHDIHILYWWLLGLPMVAIGLPLVFVFTELFRRIFFKGFFLILERLQNKG